MNSISIGESQLAPIEILFIHKMQIKSNCPVKTWQRKYLQPSVPSQTKLMKKYRLSTPILAELWKQAKPYSNKAIPNKEKGKLDDR